MSDTKQSIFLKEIAFKYIPEFITNISLQQHYIDISKKYPKSISVENLTEIALSIVGNYNFIDEQYQDFDDIDRSDSKTTSIIFSSKQIYLGGIGKKVGALRITIYNPHTQSLDYMFLPYGEWQRLAKKCHGENTEGKLRLIMSWTADRDSYNMFELYRLNTFAELAIATSETFYKKYPHLLNYESTTFNNIFGEDADEDENILDSEDILN